MVVADVMNKNPVTVSARETLSSALRTLRAAHVSLLPVVEDGRLVGLLTDLDACWDLPDLESREVGAVMDPHPEHVRPQASLREAARVFLSRERPALPVVDEGRLVGLLSPHDLLRASLEALDSASPAVTTLLTVPRGGGLALAEISSLIRAHGGDLLATMRESAGGPDVAYRLRVSTPDPDALVSLLEARGHRVVASTTNDEVRAAASATAAPC